MIRTFFSSWSHPQDHSGIVTETHHTYTQEEKEDKTERQKERRKDRQRQAEREKVKDSHILPSYHCRCCSSPSSYPYPYHISPPHSATFFFCAPHFDTLHSTLYTPLPLLHYYHSSVEGSTCYYYYHYYLTLFYFYLRKKTQPSCSDHGRSQSAFFSTHQTC